MLLGLVRKGRTRVGPVAGFGKIPALGDFVRAGQSSDEMNAFELWVTRAMETAEAHATESWSREFAHGTPHAFVWSTASTAKSKSLLAGVIAPSHDALGRRFPFVIASPLPTSAFAAGAHGTWLVLADFFQRAALAASRSGHARSSAEVQAEVAQFAPPLLDHADAAVASYAAWAKGSRASDVWSTFFGNDLDRVARYALYMLVEATTTYRGKEAPPLSLGLRVPLGWDAPRGAAIWVDLVRHAAGWRTTVPIMFSALGGHESADSAPPASMRPDSQWQNQPPSSVRGGGSVGNAWAPPNGGSRGLIQLGAEAPATVLADLWAPSRDGEAVCNVVPAASARFPSEFPAAVQRAFGNPAATFADVLVELGR